MLQLYLRRFKYFFTYLIFLFSPYFLKSQNNYDSIFNLKGVERTAYLHNTLNGILLSPNKIKDLNVLVQQKGSESDKLITNYTLKRIEIREHKSDWTINKEIAVDEDYLIKAQKLKDHFLQAFFYFSLSEKYHDINQFDKSFEYKLYALDELSKDPKKLFFKQTWFLHQIASEFYHFNDYNKAAELSSAAFNIGGNYNPNVDWFNKIITNLAGMSYLKMNKYDSAKVWLQKCYDIALAQGDTAWQGIATGNLGSIYYIQNKCLEAIPLYENALLLCRKARIWDNIAAFSCNLADCHLKSGEIALAKVLLDEATAANNKQYNINNKVKYYEVFLEYYKRVSNAPLALMATDSLNFYLKKQQIEYNINNKVKAEGKLAYHNKELEIELANQKIKKGKWILAGILIFTLSSAAVGILLFKRNRLRYLLKQKKLETEKLIAEDALQIAQIQLNDFNEKVKEKNNLIDQFSNELEKLKQINPDIIDQNTEILALMKESVILTEDDWIKFKRNFEIIHPGFISNLKNSFPDLTNAELRYLVFCKLDLQPKEMAAMLGVSAEAIRNVRFRVKKKMKMEDSDKIEESTTLINLS